MPKDKFPGSPFIVIRVLLLPCCMFGIPCSHDKLGSVYCEGLGFKLVKWKVIASNFGHNVKANQNWTCKPCQIKMRFWTHLLLYLKNEPKKPLSRSWAMCQALQFTTLIGKQFCSLGKNSHSAYEKDSSGAMNFSLHHLHA